MTSEQAEFAAAWWALKLESRPKTGLIAGHDAARQAHGPTRLTEVLLGALWEATPPMRIAAFYRVLKELLLLRPVSFLGTDYEPCATLHEAGVLAGIPHLQYRLPCKTRMYIHPTHIEVSEGYGVPRRVVFGAKPAES